jgi:hypothetical protein
MPLFALALRIFYFRSDFYFIEHLVFTMHAHSFSFIVLTFYIFLHKVLPTTTIPFLIVFIGMYVIIAMKQFYKQSWKKTVLKFFLIHVVNWGIACAAVAVTLLLSLALF